MGERFTSWLATDERSRLRTLAASLNVSENFIVRLAVRHVVLGAPIPGYVQQAAEQVRAGNTSNTSNADKKGMEART